jgi:hypothetical protein
MHDWLDFFHYECKNGIVHHAFYKTFGLLWYDYITLLSVMKCPVCNDLHFHSDHICHVPIVATVDDHQDTYSASSVRSQQRFSLICLNQKQINWHQLAELIRLNEKLECAPLSRDQQILYFSFLLQMNGLEWNYNSQLCKALLIPSITIHEVLCKLKRSRYLRQYTDYYKCNIQNLDYETEKKPLIDKLLKEQTLLQEYPPYFPFEVGIFSCIYRQRQRYYKTRYQNHQWSKEKLIQELLCPFIL